MENKKVIVYFDLIVGLLYEDFLSFKRSFNKIILYFVDEVQFGFLKMLKGIKIREEVIKYNYEFFKDLLYEVILNSFISFEEIYKFKKMEDLIDKVYNRQYFYFILRYIF